MKKLSILIACALVAWAGLADGVAVDDDIVGIPIPPKPASSQGQVVVYESTTRGPIKMMNCVNGAPHVEGSASFRFWKNLEIPFGRTHDFGLVPSYGGSHSVDVASIFRNFEADENDPANYDFANTDMVLKRMRAAGTQPFYRLGGEYEGWLNKRYTVYPPKDPAKWARICEHIVRHYNEGWANGFNWNIEYWEVWNEPDLMTDRDNGANGMFWAGPREKFVELFKTTLLHLKKCFPNIKVGGAAFAGPISDWTKFLVADFATNAIPLDFYSWHQYARNANGFNGNAKAVRELLDANGYTKTESIFDEWNYVKGWDQWDQEYSFSVERGRFVQKGAAFVAGALCELQNQPVDMAMLYDAATFARMNTLFDAVSGYPLPAYYALYSWTKLRRLGTQVKATSSLEDVFVSAARNEKGALGILVARYDEDNNVTRPVIVTLRLASGATFKGAQQYLTDDYRTFTETPLELNTDGSANLELRPCSFAFIACEAPEAAE